MASPGSRSFRAVLIGCGLVAVAGGGLLLWSRTLPVFSVPTEQASAVYQSWCTATGPDDAIGARYRALFGWRYALSNAGLQLILAALTAAALAGWLRLTRLETPGWLRTPGNRWSFIAWGVLAMVLMVPGVGWGLQLDLERQVFPWCADSIGIPMAGFVMAVMLFTPILTLAGFAISLGFGRLPVSLAHWDRARPRRSWIVSILFGTALAAWLAGTAASLTSADLTSPSAVLMAWLLASTRAALLAPRVEEAG